MGKLINWEWFEGEQGCDWGWSRVAKDRSSRKLLELNISLGSWNFIILYDRSNLRNTFNLHSLFELASSVWQSGTNGEPHWWTPLVRGQTPMNPGFIARSGGRPKLWTFNRSIFLNLMKFLISWFDTSGSLISLVEFNKWILRAFEFIHNFKLEIYADYVPFTEKTVKKQS